MTERRRPVWRGAALLLGGLGLGFLGVVFGVFGPIAFVRGSFEGGFVVFGLHVKGVPGGLDVAGVAFPWALVVGLLMPLGIANVAAVIVAGLRQRVLPMAVMAAVWFLVALATVILSRSATDFLATQTLLLLLALVAAWPEVRDFASRT